MLEIALPPSVHPCHTALERETMSEKKRSESTREAAKLDREKVSHEQRHHRYGRSSAEDPAISSTKTEKYVSSNARAHPRAERESSGSAHSSSKPRHVSNHVPNHVMSKSHDQSPSNGKRKRSSEEEEDVWTEHTSSTGRVYFYNKKLDKSQWERPKGAVKRLKSELTPGSSGGSQKANPASSSSSFSTSSKPISAIKHHSSSHYSSGSAHKESGYHGDSNHREASLGHKDHAHGRSHAHHGSHGDKEKSHHHPHHPHKRHSHSRSTSPTVSSSGRQHGGSGGGSHDKDRTPGNYRSVSSSNCTSKSVTSPLTTKTAISTSIISPSGGGTPSIIQTLSTTQQMIDQGLMIIEEREKLIAGDGMTPGQASTTITSSTSSSTPVATPTLSYTPTSGGAGGGGHHPHARQKLMFNQVANGPFDSPAAASHGTPVQAVYGSVSGMLTPTHSNIMASMDSMGLHPLQKALLLQNQFTQQGFIAQDPSMTVATPPIGVPVPALPFYMGTQHHQQQQSHPNSPLMHSPILNLGPPSSSLHIVGGGPYTPQTTQAVVLQQTMAQATPYNVAMQPVGPHPSFLTPGGAGELPMAGMLPVASPTVQTPMFRLGYRGDASSYASFPDGSAARPAPPSAVNFDLYDRRLTECWTQFNEAVQKQRDACSHETEVRRTEMIALSGRVNRTQLILKTSQVRVNSRQTRIASLRKLMQDVDKR